MRHDKRIGSSGIGSPRRCPRGSQTLVAIVLLIGALAALARGTVAGPVRDVGVVAAPPRYGGEVLYSNSWALLIGINEYRNLPDRHWLRFAEHDVDAFRDALLNIGFPDENVVVLKGRAATAAAIEDTLLRRLTPRLGPDDRLVIYFAGHGVTAPSAAQEDGFLVPWDGDLGNLAGTALSMSRLRELSRTLTAKHVLLLVDACYSGFVVTTRSLPQHLDRKVLRLWTGAKAVQVLTAGKKGELAEERPLYGHGVFTKWVIDGLLGGADLDGDGLVSFLELALFVKTNVARDSRSPTGQDPQSSSLLGEGQVVFVLPESLRNASGQERKGGSLPAGRGSGLSRFVDQGDGTVWDTRTNLLWSKNASPLGPPSTWHDAVRELKSQTIAGRRGWRLPTRSELETTMAAVEKETGRYFTNIREGYWTRTEFSEDAAYIVNVTESFSATAAKGKTRMHVWPVLEAR